MMEFAEFTSFNLKQKIEDDLSLLPAKMINLVNKYGIKIYQVNNKTADEIDLKNNQLAYYDPNRKVIVIHDTYIKFDIELESYSTILHEFGHALDDVLAMELFGRHNIYFTHFNYWFKANTDKGLDFHARENQEEYFATAFMSYFMINKSKEKMKGIGEHNRDELQMRDPKMYTFIDELVKIFQ